MSVHLSVHGHNFFQELPLLNHPPFCDQNLLYDNVMVGGMITFSDSSSFHHPRMPKWSDTSRKYLPSLKYGLRLLFFNHTTFTFVTMAEWIFYKARHKIATLQTKTKLYYIQIYKILKKIPLVAEHITTSKLGRNSH